MSGTGQHYLITGANGFVGRRLVAGLLGRPNTLSITQLDLAFTTASSDERLKTVTGSIADIKLVRDLCVDPIDCIFHLACIPGGAAEANFDLGKAVNLDGTIGLLESLRQLSKAPKFVFTSSVGVFGAPPATIADDTPPSPVWSYGAHKAACEYLVADYTRKGWIDGRTVRLPAIVPRPPIRNGAVSIFQSDLIHELSAGREFVCPVSALASTWWMSLDCCVENLLLAAEIDGSLLKGDRTYTLPVLRTTIAEVVSGIATLFGTDAEALISYAPVAQVEKMFGMLPPVVVPLAEAVGFRNDGSVEQMLKSALRSMLNGR